MNCSKLIQHFLCLSALQPLAQVSPTAEVENSPNGSCKLPHQTGGTKNRILLGLAPASHFTKQESFPGGLGS